MELGSQRRMPKHLADLPLLRLSFELVPGPNEVPRKAGPKVNPRWEDV